MDFSELEASEGLRWTWHGWPVTRKAAESLIIPLAIMCCPLAQTPDLATLPYSPVRCPNCSGVLNPYARLDPASKRWTCPFCFHHNTLPLSHHDSISDGHSLPAELFPTHTCVEYLPPPATGAYAVSYQHHPPPPSGPAFVFVIDTCLPADELLALKSAISHSQSLLPENALVGLISFACQVHVHDLSFSHHYSKSFVFEGARDLTSQRIQELLGISNKFQKLIGVKQGGLSNFLVPFSDYEFNFSAVLEEIQPHFTSVYSKHRPQRATGTAIAVSVALLEGRLASSGSRILLFTGGPATIGQGMVVGTSLEETIRTHKDLISNRAAHTRNAEKFYKHIEETLVSRSLILDFFACSLDQVGIHEVKSTVEMSGGLLVLAETFDSDEFKISLQRLFERDKDGLLKMYFNATIEVITSQKLKISGALGPCSSLSNKSISNSDRPGVTKSTNTWKLCTLTDKTNIAFLFEVPSRSSNISQPGTAFIIQFITKYQKSDGQIRMRVTTTARRWIDGTNFQELKESFDQEAAAAVVARMAVSRVAEQDSLDVIAWLERMLIRFASKFGDYMKEVPESFRLSPHFSLFPQFIFYLRRSQFLQVSNNTPDETAFFRLMLNREGVVRTVIMIQPSLLCYSLDGPPRPVLLDISSVKPDTVLLFDAYFVIVVHYGSTIAQWRKLNYHLNPAHENFKKLLEEPVLDAQSLLAERNPLPKFVQCDQSSSQARFLLAKLNPSVTHRSENSSGSELIFTDDVSLEVFIDHLQELAVKDDDYI